MDNYKTVQLHWYLMVYESVHGGIPKQTIYESFEHKDSISFDAIQNIKKKRNMPVRAILTNVAYLGYMTEAQFYDAQAGADGVEP